MMTNVHKAQNVKLVHFDLVSIVSCSSNHFGRGIVMPNLKPPVTTTAAAVAYRESILKALPAGSDFTPLMTLYLTDTTSPNEIKLASKFNNNKALFYAYFRVYHFHLGLQKL